MMELPKIAAYAYQDVHVWSALLTCLRPATPWPPAYASKATGSCLARMPRSAKSAIPNPGGEGARSNVGFLTHAWGCTSSWMYRKYHRISGIP